MSLSDDRFSSCLSFLYREVERVNSDVMIILHCIHVKFSRIMNVKKSLNSAGFNNVDL